MGNFMMLIVKQWMCAQVHITWWFDNNNIQYNMHCEYTAHFTVFFVCRKRFAANKLSQCLLKVFSTLRLSKRWQQICLNLNLYVRNHSEKKNVFAKGISRNQLQSYSKKSKSFRKRTLLISKIILINQVWKFNLLETKSVFR